MTSRKLVLWAVETFLCVMLWKALAADSPNAASYFWPGCAALIACLLIPHERMEGQTFVDLVKAYKGRDE